jgi:hypothetical protein
MLPMRWMTSIRQNDLDVYFICASYLKSYNFQGKRLEDEGHLILISVYLKKKE